MRFTASFASRPMEIQACECRSPAFFSSNICLIHLPDRTSCIRGWYLMSLCLGCFPPSEKFEKYLENYILGNVVTMYTTYCWSRLDAICNKEEGYSRTSPPSGIELTAARDQVLIPLSISLDDGKVVEIFIESTTRIEEVVQAAARILNLKHVTGFTISKNGLILSSSVFLSVFSY